MCSRDMMLLKEVYVSVKVENHEIIKTSKIIFIEWVSIISIFLICFVFLFNEMRRLESKIDQQTSRTDKLYEMFIDLLKESRK